MWNKIASYPVDEDGLGETVPVAWRRGGGRVVRMASGFLRDGKWSWLDPFERVDLEPPDFWFALPSLRSSEVWGQRA